MAAEVSNDQGVYLGAVINFEVIQSLLLVAMVFVSALLLLKISQTFHSRGNYLQAFTTVAYGFSPMFLFRLLDAGPMVIRGRPG